MPDLRKIFLNPYAIVVAIAIALVAVMTIASRSDGSETDTSVTLVGNWHQVEGPKGTYMTATIYGGTIQIDMESRDATYPYWLGTFDTGKNTAGAFKTTSIGDSDAMALSIFGSNSKTKSFTYKNGVISFEFTMLGSTSTIKLEKNKDPEPIVTITKTPTATAYPPLKIVPKVIKTPTKSAPKAPVYKAPSTSTKK